MPLFEPAQLGSCRLFSALSLSYQAEVQPLTRSRACSKYFQTDADARGLTQWLALDDDLNDWPEDRLHLVVAPTDSWHALVQLGVADELSAAPELLCSDSALP